MTSERRIYWELQHANDESPYYMRDKMTPEELNIGLHANAHDLGDSWGVESIGMRDRFKKHSWNFFMWANELVIKVPRTIFLKLIEDELRTAWAGSKWSSTTFGEIPFYPTNKETLLVEQLGNNSIVFSLGAERSMLEESIILNEDLLKVSIAINVDRDDDDYYGETEGPTADVPEILLATVTVMGDVELGKKFLEGFKRELKQVQEQDKVSLVKWIFSVEHGSRERCFRIKKDWTVDSSFYPWIGGDLTEYYRKFLESQSQILVCFGDPGTGKTTFLRDLICETGLNAYISYDPKIITSDSTFIKYLTNAHFDMVIIEDADELLTSGRGEYNKIIAKILNVSDGLIKLPRKKLIFTTNLSNVKNIDPAIIRPGRCFDVLEFRKLTYDEALAVCEKIGIKIPSQKPTYTLAELFFFKDIQENTDPFVRKHGEKLEKKFGF